MLININFFFQLLEKKLSYEIKYRNIETIKILMKLTENLNFFKNLKAKFDEKCHYECCRNMQLLIINEPNHILFNQGTSMR